MRMGSCFRASIGALGLCIFLTSGAVGAEPSAGELAAARDMFNEARQAEDAGNWPEALRKLKAVAEVKLTAQVRFHIGLCEEQLGQLIEALNDFERAKIEAGEQHVSAVAEEAPAHAARVRARLPTLILQMPPDTSNASVAIDDQPISAALAARPVPLNPGEHTVSVSAPGKIYRERFGFAEKEERKVDVVFSAAPLELAPRSETPPAAARASLPISGGASAPGANRTLGWALVGVGGAALVGAGVSTLVRAGALSDIESECPTHRDCPPSLRDSQSRAKTFGALALGLGIAGVASATLGVVLVTRAAPSEPRAASLGVGPWAAPGAAGAVGRLEW
jgi:hypothetical protein